MLFGDAEDLSLIDTIDITPVFLPSFYFHLIDLGEYTNSPPRDLEKHVSSSTRYQTPCFPSFLEQGKPMQILQSYGSGALYNSASAPKD